ncbi:MAG: hypothetical protein IT522_10435 [Burkholderiales bacterium]|nr:hypothetical protein [Burkholderiales bacterium]
MSRFLFVVPPFAAHVNPAASIATELADAGHECAWVTYPQMRPLLAADARAYDVQQSTLVAAEADLRRAAAAPWLAGMRALFERILVPMAHDMLPIVEAAVTDFRPDVVIADQQAIAAALVARKHRLRWVTSAPSASLLRDRIAQYTAVAAWVAGLYANLEREIGLVPVAHPDLSPDLVLIYTSRYLAGDAVAYPASYRFVGPALAHRAESVAFPWERLTGRKTLVVSFGTLFAERVRPLYARLVEALRDEDVTVVIGTPPDLLRDPPKNFIVRPWLPLMDLLPRTDAILCHAGVIVNEALSFGVPAVVAPMAHEQSIYAELVVTAGAGVRVRSNRVAARALHEAVFSVLDGAGFRSAAQRVAASFRDAGGAPAAARAILEVLAR